MRLSDLIGHRVISTGDATTIGRIRSAVFDPEGRRIRSYRLDGASGVLPVGVAQGIGDEAVMVPVGTEPEDPTDPADVRAVEHDLGILGARVLTDQGDEIETVRDLEIDPLTGDVEAVVVGDERFPGRTLMGVGTYAVVLEVPAEA